jgi:ABC-type uncharacterized transport system substrate-binding protein
LLSAHPHLFIDVELEKRENTIAVDWVFDDMNSEILIMDYDSNFDEKFSEEEITLFIDEVFINMILEYHFYTYLKVDSKDIPIESIFTNFLLKIRERRFIMSFELNLAEFQKADFELSFYDESYMSSMEIKNPKGFQDFKVGEHIEFYGYTISWKGV